MSEQPAGGLRADVWLWAARFFRTRALAKQAIDEGHARDADYDMRTDHGRKEGVRF